MSESYLCHHMERYHCIVLPDTRGVDAGGKGGIRYLQGVFYADPEVGGMPGRRVYGEGKNQGVCRSTTCTDIGRQRWRL